VEMVIRQLLANADVAKQAVVNAVVSLRNAPPSPCVDALKDAIITQPAAIPDEIRKRLALLLDNRR
jgi:5'-methylthioadenosine phosphorylase